MSVLTQPLPWRMSSCAILPGMTKRAATYRRISRDREGLELGATRQSEDCEALATGRGLTVVADYCDNDISASTKSRKSRPEYERMLQDARAGQFDVILAYTTGRLTRRPREFEDLIDLSVEHGVEFKYVRSPSFDLNTAQGRRIARTLAAQDAGEAEDIAERVQRQKVQAATEGKWLGGRRPFGYEADGVTIRESEAAIIRQATDAILAGSSLRGYAAQLNLRQVVTSTGKPWTPVELRKVLVRARNAGLMEHRGVVVGPAEWSAIVEPDRWRALVAVVNDPARRTQWTSARKWMLSGIARCYCGAPVSASMNNTTRRGQPAYLCKAGKHVGRNAREMDDFISGLVIARLSRPDAIELLAAAEGPDIAAMHAEAAGLQDRLTQLATAFAEGAITPVQLREGSAVLRDKLARVEATIAEASRGSVLAGLAGTPDVSEAWAGLDMDRRRAVIDTLMSITIHRTKKGRPAGWKAGDSYFNPETIQIDWKS